MYLKRISVHGFKSFPDRVDFDFSPGVTCIVGPNGCGKSNIVDAFKWVLGEQSAKLLRGRQMTDMIFNGSSTRKSSGLARVELIFDNACRTLPLDQDQVSVTRKLFRSGESEYLINDQTARLKDIRELFLDTGVGADTYSVIEQGRVDILLSSSPIERRAIFEEAAGIGKYKIRRREAQRKLERTEQNLLRVNDIVEEVQKRLRSVKLQAGKARSFQAYESRLAELRAAYSVSEYHRLTESVDRLRHDADNATDQTAGLRAAIDRNEADTAKLGEVTDRLTEELSQAEQSLMRTRSDVATHEERVEAARKRIAEQNSALQRVDTRVGNLADQRDRYLEQLTDIQTEVESLQHDKRQNELAIRELSERGQLSDRELTEVRALLDDEKDGLVELVRRSTHLRNEIARLDTHRQGLQAQQHRLGERDAQLRSQIQEHLCNRTALETRFTEIDQLIDAETARLSEKRCQAEQLETRRVELNDALGDAKELRSALRSRLQVLAELERKMEGVDAGVRSLLQQKAARPDDPALAGICGMVAELFEADVSHARVIEAAIGDSDQYLVLDHSNAFLKNKELYQNLPGRLTVICLDRLPPVINEPDPTDAPGYVANAVQFIHFDPRYELLAKHLLAKTIVVDTLQNALAMAANDISSRRFVTLAGEVVEPNGAISLGPPTSRAGLVARKSERRDLGTQLEGAEERIRTTDEHLNRVAAEAAHLREVQNDLQNAIYESGKAKVEANAALQSVAEAIRRLTEEQPLIAGEVAMIEQQLAEARTLTSQSEASAGKVDQENVRLEHTVAEYNQRIETLTVERDRLRYELTEARIAAGRIATKRAALADTINHLRNGIKTAEQAISAAENERIDGHKRIEDSENTILAARRQLDELAAAAERLEAAVIQIRRRREMTRLESEQLAARTREFRSELVLIESQLHQAQLQLQEASVRRDELCLRVKEELDIDLAEMYQSYEHGEQDWEQVEAEISELRQKIARLGNVNLDAINELTDLEQREQFLTVQLEDLEDSRRQLADLIAKLDAESIERFTTAFDTIRANFRELFRKLFGGGKADIILENPDDVLESGIEILAKPPGKELQRITLMSGGEKTMTAIALLMSIFRSRPSPLALLDEVDAALDEANNERYNAIIREFLDRSQFILVTHSKRTMAIADHLYGITMQEPGVSARVSVKFDTNTPAVA